MKRVSILLVLCLMLAPVFSQEIPPLRSYVNDYAGMISGQTEKLLIQNLAALDKSDSTQIFVLTVNSLEGYPIEYYSMKVAETWKAGSSTNDNGIIFLVAKEDRKTRIEVGYGLEGVVTDLLAGRILDQVVAPCFQEGNYDKGVADGVATLIRAVKGEYQNDPNKLPSNKRRSTSNSVLVLLALIGIISMVIKSFSVKASMGLGAIGGFTIPFLLGSSSVGACIIFLVIGMFSPFITEFALRMMVYSRLGGGGSSGGSFSGGGGGSFGGGGASGSW